MSARGRPPFLGLASAGVELLLDVEFDKVTLDGVETSEVLADENGLLDEGFDKATSARK